MREREKEREKRSSASLGSDFINRLLDVIPIRIADMYGYALILFQRGNFQFHETQQPCIYKLPVDVSLRRSGSAENDLAEK